MNKLINEKLIDIRKQHKLSRKGIEHLSGFKERTIASYERGEREPSKEYLEFISLYFGYSTGYLEGSTQGMIGRVCQTFSIYERIYDYDDIKMADLLDMEALEYTDLKNEIVRARQALHSCKLSYNIFIIAEKLNIKPSCFGFYPRQQSTLVTICDEEYTVSNYQERYKKLEKSGVTIDANEYAKVIKKRNEPQKSYTPLTDTNELPEKYKEIVELLPFAPDNFIDTLIEKLKTLKEVQKL